MVTDIDSPKSCSKNNWFSGKYKFNLFDSSTEELDWLFYKSQNFISIQTCDRPSLKKPEREHIFMTFTQKGGGAWEVLNIHCVFPDSILFKQKIYWWKWGGGVFVGYFLWTSFFGWFQRQSPNQKDNPPNSQSR